MKGALFLPWIDLSEVVTVGDVTFYSFADALQLAGKNGRALHDYGSIYVDGYTLPLAIERAESVPRLRPTVAFVADDDAGARRVRDAVDVLMLSTIFENGIIPANSTTFAYVVRPIDGDPNFMVDFTPRMAGSSTNGIVPQTYLEMRPPRTGTFHYGRRTEMVAALLAALSGPFASELRAILDTLRTAMSESADISMDLAESLLAKAATLLTYVAGTPDRKREMLARLQAMLTGVIPASTADEYGTYIARVWQAVRDHRNEFWHPSPHPATASPSRNRPSSRRFCSRCG